MLRVLCYGSLWLSFICSASAFDAVYSRCHCETDGFWSLENIQQCQKVSDFLIATAYFSIPLELLYFLVRSNVFPFRWILFQFGAFIVLCGLTHLLGVFTYEPHSFHLILAVTVSKFLTALVSFATAVTLLTLIPQLLRIKVRESLLWIKASELNHEVSMMKRQEATSLHVRMLTQEIRKSLDRHTILYTTLVTLSNTLGLKNCVIWMPDKEKKEMHLTHELRRNVLDCYGVSIQIDDPEVVQIEGSSGVKVLSPDSVIGSASGGGGDKSGAAAAIRMPMLKVSNFKGGTPEFVQTCYAILVLVLPGNDSREWSNEELELIEVVADQVAVALSHAAVLEESQMMRDELAERNRTLLKAKEKALMSSEARNSFQRAMGRGMGRPIHSISALLSLMQQENLGLEQRLVIDTMAKASDVVSALINDVTELSNLNHERVFLEIKEFRLQSMIKEAAAAAKCLCDCRGFGFVIQVANGVPSRVIGDEKRIFHVILHMVGSLLNICDEGCVKFLVHGLNDSEKIEYNKCGRLNSSDAYNDYNHVEFEIIIKRHSNDHSNSSAMLSCGSHADGSEMGLSFGVCKKLVQMMNGSIWVVPNSQGLAESMVMVLQFPLNGPEPIPELQGPSGSLERSDAPSIPQFKGLRVLLVDEDDVTRAVTRKLLEKLGCRVTSVSGGAQCMSSLAALSPFQLVVLDLEMSSMDGFEVAVRVRKFRSVSSLLIVGLTAGAKEDVWGRCMQCGINGLVQKPVVLRAVGDELLRILQSR